MIFLFLMLLLGNAISAPVPGHWDHVIEVTDRHEFYQNGALVVKPRNAWQTLFSLVYYDRNLSRQKDCVFYRVPGDDSGILKVLAVSPDERCDDFYFRDQGLQIDDVRSLRFNISETGIWLEVLRGEKRFRWDVVLPGAFKKPLPISGLSSSDFKAPGLILLAPAVANTQRKLRPFPKNDSICHGINEDCTEAAPSTCGSCESGWYEIPNGCAVGPRFCGVLRCGKKNGPACRRGLRWSRSDDEFDCRTNSSFAYCASGLTVVCEGRKAYCR